MANEADVPIAELIREALRYFDGEASRIAFTGEEEMGNCRSTILRRIAKARRNGS